MFHLSSPPLVQPLVIMIFLFQDGLCPLYSASGKGHLDVVKTLIEAGANVIQDNKVRCTHTVSPVLVMHSHLYI